MNKLQALLSEFNADTGLDGNAQKEYASSVNQYIHCLKAANHTFTEDNLQTLHDTLKVVGDVFDKYSEDLYNCDTANEICEIIDRHYNFVNAVKKNGEDIAIKDALKQAVIAENFKNDEENKVPTQTKDVIQKYCKQYMSIYDCREGGNHLITDDLRNAATHVIAGHIISELIRYEAQDESGKALATNLVNNGKMGELADKIIGSAAFDNLGKKISYAKSVDACNRIINDMLTNPKECFTVGANYLQSLKNPEDKMKNKDLTHKLQNGGIVNKPK